MTRSFPGRFSFLFSLFLTFDFGFVGVTFSRLKGFLERFRAPSLFYFDFDCVMRPWTAERASATGMDNLNEYTCTGAAALD
jgi:hypothetical protein